MPRRNNGEQHLMEVFEDRLAALAGVPICTKIVRIRLRHALARSPQLAPLLAPIFNELNEIDERATSATNAGGDYHRHRWRQE